MEISRENINFKRGYSNSSFLNQYQGVHGLSGHCPVLVDVFLGISGQCPDFPLLSLWTMSRESNDNIQGDGVQCLLSPWTLTSLSGSLDFVQSIHGHCPLFPLIPWIQWTILPTGVLFPPYNMCIGYSIRFFVN